MSKSIRKYLNKIPGKYVKGTVIPSTLDNAHIVETVLM